MEEPWKGDSVDMRICPLPSTLGLSLPGGVRLQNRFAQQVTKRAARKRYRTGLSDLDEPDAQRPGCSQDATGGPNCGVTGSNSERRGVSVPTTPCNTRARQWYRCIEGPRSRHLSRCSLDGTVHVLRTYAMWNSFGSYRRGAWNGNVDLHSWLQSKHAFFP